jgi:hypothetical protein
MTVKALYPNLRPSLLLDFANTKDLDPRITFTRTTTARYYDGKTTAKAEENLLLYSQEFNESAWTKSVANFVTANTGDTTAPDGTNTAEIFTDQAINSAQRVTISAPLLASTRYVLSVFVKNITRRYFSMAITGTTNLYFGATYDLVGETVTATRQFGTGFAHVSSSITAVGNSWYRIVLIGDVGTTVSTPLVSMCLNTTGTPTTDGRGTEAYIGDGSQVYVWGAQLEQRDSVTAYTPTTTQPVTNYIPALQTAAAGVARFDHNPVTGESLGLLIEEQRSNLLTYSDDFADASWVKTATTNRSFVSSNVLIGPDGLLSADKLYESELNVDHWLRKAFNFSASTNYTFSIYAKAAERTIFRLTAAGADQGAYFNLSDGTIGTVQSGVTAAITSVGNGWYRCSISWTQASGLNDYVYIRFALVNNGSGSYTGDGYSGIYIWGAQLEAGAFPTSYIKTEGSTVTRNADDVSMAASNFSSWFSTAEGTFYTECVQPSANSVNKNILLVTDDRSAAPQRIEMRAQSTTNVPRLLINVSAGVTVADFSFSAVTTNSTNKSAIAYANNNFAAVVNAQAVQTDTSGLVPPSPNIMTIGSANVNSNVLNGTLKKIAFYPKRLSNAELASLTTV